MQKIEWIEWDNAWNTGIHEIDDDHKGLIVVINQVLALCEGSADKRQLRSAASKLIKYVGSHFQREEDILASKGYPYLNEHKEEHFRLKYAALNVKKKLLDDGYNQRSAQKLKDFLLGPWLVGHLQVGDQKFAQYFASK